MCALHCTMTVHVSCANCIVGFACYFRSHLSPTAATVSSVKSTLMRLLFGMCFVCIVQSLTTAVRVL